MLGLGAAALFLWNNRGASEDAQTQQLTGAAMMAAGEGTAPDAPFQAYSAPANPIFFFNQGGEMAQIPGTNVPRGASSDEDIGVYPGGGNQPELEFTVARGVPPTGTSDISPGNPLFAGSPNVAVTPSTVWDEPAQAAAASQMPVLAIQDVKGPMGNTGIKIFGEDIAVLDSKEHFRAVNVDTGFSFHTTGEVLGEYVRGFTNTGPGPVTNSVLVSATPPQPFIATPQADPVVTTYDTSVPTWATHEDAWWNEG